MTRRLTIIESPFSSKNGRTVFQNEQYLRQCLRDSWDRGELPFASHGFFPQFLDEDSPQERKEGIEAGYQFWDLAPEDLPYDNDQKPKIVFYCDYGISTGMHAALTRAKELRREIEIRYILPNILPKEEPPR